MEYLHEILHNELANLETEFDRIIDKGDSLISEVGAYVLKAGGKRLRPSFVFLGGKIFDGNLRNLSKVALLKKFRK